LSSIGELEWNGILIDTDILEKLSCTIYAQVGAVAGEIFKMAGIEFNLTHQEVSDVLFGRSIFRTRKNQVGSLRPTSMCLKNWRASTR